MDFKYIVLVIVGFFLAVLGFYGLGGGKLNPVSSGLLFIAGIVSLVVGILLTCVPGFFSG